MNYETITKEAFIKAMESNLTGYVRFYGWFFFGGVDFIGTEVCTDTDFGDYILLKTRESISGVQISINNIESLVVANTATEIVYVLEGGIDNCTIQLYVSK